VAWAILGDLRLSQDGWLSEINDQFENISIASPLLYQIDRRQIITIILLMLIAKADEPLLFQQLACI